MYLNNAWFITILYMVLITIISHIPGDEISEIPPSDIENVDILFHFGEYSILGFLLFKSNNFYNFTFFSPFHASVIIGITFAVFDELHQNFIPGRIMSFMDLLFDSIGLFFGFLIFYYFNR